MKKKTLQSLLGQISGMTLGFRCAAGVKSQKHARMHRDRDVVGGGESGAFPFPQKVDCLDAQFVGMFYRSGVGG